MIFTAPDVCDWDFPTFCTYFLLSVLVSFALDQQRPCIRRLNLLLFLVTSQLILNLQSQENSRPATAGTAYAVPIDVKLFIVFLFFIHGV